MAPSADTSFAAHVQNQFTSYEKDRQMKSDEVVYTTSNGAPEPHPYEAQRAGENGPLLLQDFHLIDLLSHFDRERIPERVVHAKGGGAHGFFECTEAIPELTCMNLFQEVGKKAPMSARFSTVGGESGTPDLMRDPRGFSLKFRTEEGNWDVVANNTPVFFLRDPAKFPNFIHTQKRHPSTHMNHMTDATMFWDYLSQNPESIHQVMVLMGDRGIPDSWRKMHGWYGHTMKFVNKDGDWNYVQMHFKSQQGTSFFTTEESEKYPPDYSIKDLYDAIEKGDYPKWDISIQIMSPQQAEAAWTEKGINVLDLTHVWPHADYPLRKIGEFTLNENPINYFAEIEQIAFSPSHLVPGIEPSADPVLQSRLFSYPDTHRHRLGVNYQQLPVNAPRPGFKMGNFQRDGPMCFYSQGARLPYLASVDPIKTVQRPVDRDATHGHFIGEAVTWLSEIRPEDFNGPRALWHKVLDEPARERMVENIVNKMGLCSKDEIIKRQIAIFREVDEDLAARIEKGTGIKGYAGIKDMKFNGTHNGMSKDRSTRQAYGVKPTIGNEHTSNKNGGPILGSHGGVNKAVNGNAGVNGHLNGNGSKSNGIAAH